MWAWPQKFHTYNVEQILHLRAIINLKVKTAIHFTWGVSTGKQTHTQAHGPLIIRVNMISLELERGRVSQLFTGLASVWQRERDKTERERFCVCHVSWSCKLNFDSVCVMGGDVTFVGQQLILQMRCSLLTRSCGSRSRWPVYWLSWRCWRSCSLSWFSPSLRLLGCSRRNAHTRMVRLQAHTYNTNVWLCPFSHFTDTCYWPHTEL